MAMAVSRAEQPLDSIIRRVIGIDPQDYPADASLLSFGADSLSLLVVSGEINKVFGVQISFRDLLGELGVLSRLKAHLEQLAPPASPSSRSNVAEPTTARQPGLQAAQPTAPAVEGPALLNAGGPGVIQFGESQTAALAGLIRRVNAKTPRSKERASRDRSGLADSRDGAGFRIPWKEICYPILSERAEGARVRDIDGNEYVDIGMGYGALLFGHSPEFLTRALTEEAGRGTRLGWHSSASGEAAQLLTELTGTERVSFCNSGTEAVMSALRLARTVTGREKIAMCAGSYHGSYDGVLLGTRRGGEPFEAMPMAAGVPASCARDAFVLPFGDIQALEKLRPYGNELAGVIVEPLPSRRPATNAGSYLKALRRFTDSVGAALIFDEVITGFRTHPGGCQALFNVRADLVTYGKTLGAGIPVGAVAGRARFIDAIDGGAWEFGDNSYPSVPTTWVTGTFFQHPFTMPCVRAVLQHLRQAGPALQENLNLRTQEFVDRLNSSFQREELPLRIRNFGSLYRFSPEVACPHWDLFFYYLLEHGVYTTETRMCYLSTAHTDADIEFLEGAVLESARAMRREGLLLAAPAEAAPLPVAASSEPPCATPGSPPAGTIKLVPLTPAQEGLLALCRLDPSISAAYHESAILQFEGEVDITSLGRAFEHVVDRHDALRATFDGSGKFQLVNPTARLDVRSLDLTSLSAPEIELRLPEEFRAAIVEPLDLESGPLVRLRTFRARTATYVCFVAHHLVVDGWSMGVIFSELMEIYGSSGPTRTQKAPAAQFSHYAERLAKQQGGASAEEAHAFWMRQLQPPLPELTLPADHPRPRVQTFTGAQEWTKLPAETLIAARAIGAAQSTTLYTVLFSGFALLLHRLCASNDLVIGTHVAAQATQGEQALVGYCVNMLPIRSRIGRGQSFGDFVSATGEKLVAAYRHQEFSLRRLVKELGIIRNPGRPPLVSVVCNLDKPTPPPALKGTKVKVLNPPVVPARFDLLWNMIPDARGLHVSATYNVSLFERQTMRRWLDEYAAMLAFLTSSPGTCLDEVIGLFEGAPHDARQPSLLVSPVLTA